MIYGLTGRGSPYFRLRTPMPTISPMRESSAAAGTGNMYGVGAVRPVIQVCMHPLKFSTVPSMDALYAEVYTSASPSGAQR